jgi:hypothetical protein
VKPVNSEPSSPPGRKKRDVLVRTSLGSYKVEQRQILYRGRVFHFVSYEDPRVQAVPAVPHQLTPSATWFLMSAGTRWGAVPQIASEEPQDTDRRLVQWLQEHIT